MRAWMATLLLVLGILGLAFAGDDDMERIDVGAKAPGFRLNDQHGKAVVLAETGKGRWTIVAFYPKSATPG